MKNKEITKLSKYRADQLFPDLLTPDQLKELQALKAPKQKMKKTKSGVLHPSGDLIIPFSDENEENTFGDDFDIWKLMDEAEDPVTGTLRDLKIDDRELPVAKNFYDFAFNIIGKDSSPPWAIQMWTGAILFGEVCPCCSNPKYLHIDNIDKNKPAYELAEHLVFLEHGKCPKCKKTKYELMLNHGLRNYAQLVNVLGQRSGKSSSCAYYAAYLTHRYLKFPNLASLSPGDMQASSELTGTFVSLNFAKAMSVMWTPYKKIIDNSTWFQDLFSLLDHYKQKYGRELYRNSSQYIKFGYKNMRFYPSGPRSSTLRGETRIFGALDELGLFPLPKGDAEEDETSERANADEAHKSLLNSLSTVQNLQLKLLKQGQSSVPSAIMFNVSSPYSQKDKMMRLLGESRSDEGKRYILGVQLPTWHVNPGYERDSPAIVMAYNANREKAERDFGANPPAVHSQFMDSRHIAPAFIGGMNSHNFKYKYDMPGRLYGEIQSVRNFGYPGIVAIDAGSVNNSFTLIGGHFNFETSKTVATTVLEVMPHEGREIDFNQVYNLLILPLCKDLNAVALFADQWQSLDILHRAETDMGMNPLNKPRLKSKKYSPKRRHFEMVRAMFASGNFILPSLSDHDKEHIGGFKVENFRTELLNKPVQHLMLQLLTVQDSGPTMCPGKGEGYTDDIFRSLVLFGSLIHEPKIMDRLKEAAKFSYSNGGVKHEAPRYYSRSGSTLFRGRSTK